MIHPIHRFPVLAVGVTLLSSSAVAQTPSLAPFKAGGHYFFVSATGAFCVRNGLQGSARQLLQARAFETLAPSWDGQYIAYSMPSYDKPSSDVIILNVSSGGVYPEVLHDARISRTPWTANNQGFFYTRVDAVDHQERIYYHTVGKPQTQDQLIYSAQDGSNWRYETRVSNDGQFAIITVFHPQDAHTRLYFIDLHDAGRPALDAPVVKLIDQFSARYTFIGNRQRSFLLQTDDSAARGRIVLANTDEMYPAHWPVFWPERPDTLQFTMAAGKDYLIAVYRNGPQSTAEVLAFPEETQSSRPMGGFGRRGGWGMSPRMGGGMGGGMGRRGGGGNGPGEPGRAGGFGRHLELKREIPIPAGGTLVDMRTLADGDEVLYTVKQSNGALVSYDYNVTNGDKTFFDTDVPIH